MYFTEERIKKISNEIKGYIYQQNEKIISYKIKESDLKGCEMPGYDTSSWEELSFGDQWGGKDKHFWFKTNVSIPENFDGKTVVYELKTGKEGQWDATNPQFLIYVNGKLIQGLDVNHREIILSEAAVAGSVFDISLHAYSGMGEEKVSLSSTIAILDKEFERLYYDIKVPLEVALLLHKEEKKRIDILEYLNETINLLDLRKPFSPDFKASVIKAQNYLKSEFYDKYCGESGVIAYCIGHTHIDVAWLWTLAQTREKSGRSFSTVLNLMKEYPEYKFTSSQPQLYEFVKEDYPEVYEEIKEKIKEGRWEAEGAMWLEADCNLSSGESLVRQILFGTRFFEKEFNVKNKILWLPDVFGYSAALPQILKKSGIDYFVTSKISWNEYNKMPYDTFLWKGIDGTEVMTHFLTAQDMVPMGSEIPNGTTYNANLNPSQVMGSWNRYQQKGLNNEVIVTYGYGDGGGGPTKEMLENSKRLSKGIPGCPKVKMSTSKEFMESLDKKVSGKKKLPNWVGELYLEYHRGTYTSMARNKKYNRKNEYLYQDIELLSVINDSITYSSLYSKEFINNAWKIILLNQFHDILPGSSIKGVYEDSLKQYLEIYKSGKDKIGMLTENIAAQIELKELSVVVFNQLGFDRNELVEFDLPLDFESIKVSDITGKVLASQLINYETPEGQIKKRVLFFAENIPSKGYKVFKLSNSGGTDFDINNIQIGKSFIKNKYFDICFDEEQNITSIFDKLNNRQILKAGNRGNVLKAFEDKPHNYDAWDINIYYQEKMWEVNDVEKVEVIEDGPVRSGIKIERKFLDSVLTQIIYTYNDIPRIDFVNKIDWKEKHILLKAAFPVDINADKATYDIQYGNVERPTHWNTSWDSARFEVCGHKWADLSEDGYGISLLNDCKYGHDIKDGTMRLTLLKSAVDPNPDADREIHEFTYSLYPHAGNWKNAGTVQMGYRLNCPVYSKVEPAHGGILPNIYSFVKVDHDNVIIEVVKKAEDCDDTIIRLYECYNRRVSSKMAFSKDIESVFECDLMENNIEQLKSNGKSFDFEIKPYEIKTFKLNFKQGNSL
jgi:alpha-mannosidase